VSAASVNALSLAAALLGGRYVLRSETATDLVLQGLELALELLESPAMAIDLLDQRVDFCSLAFRHNGYRVAKR
jgi:hypothetical protein